ncbi:UNVERIFIED_CONTAM: gamma-glutamylcyclotransferase family protein, partial [Kocuria sp. CPCC 205274]
VFIATYGSLRRSMENASVNLRGNGEFIGKGKTDDNYDLFKYGGGYFPSVSLQHNASGVPVVVDIYEAPEGHTGLTGSYDALEGYPDFYNRTEVPITLDNGDKLTAWIYHIDEVTGDRVEHGDWCLFKRGESYYEKLGEVDGENE